MALTILLIHTYYGYFASGGPAGVGVATGNAVRTSLIVVVSVTLLVSLSIYGYKRQLQPVGLGREVKRNDADAQRVAPWSSANARTAATPAAGRTELPATPVGLITVVVIGVIVALAVGLFQGTFTKPCR